MWECKRCGDCCHLLAEKEHWKSASLNNHEKEMISMGVQENESGCESLIKTNGKFSCLSQQLFGLRAKPQGCKDFTRGRCMMTTKVKQLLNIRINVDEADN